MSPLMMCITISPAYCSIVENDEQTISLDDQWCFVRTNVGSLWEVFRPVKTDSPESMPIWGNVELPHCYNATDAVDPDANYYQGPGWYRRYLDINDVKPNERLVLYFEGAGQKTNVYIYSTPVASHVGGYDEWYVDITDAVKSFMKNKTYMSLWKGKIPLAVKCDNSRDAQMIPSNLSDFPLYGGLYRHVKLLRVPTLYCRAVEIVPTVADNLKSGSVTAKLFWNGAVEIDKGNFSVEIFTPDGKIIAKSSSPNIDVEVAHPQLWSPDSPNLYTCKIRWAYQGMEQTITQRFGFRSYIFRKKGPFYLNGKRLLLRGTHIHADFAGVGAAMSDEMIRDEFRQMKEMGINFIRLGHYQQPDLVLRLCDEMGIMVWEENPWCRGGVGNETYKNQGKRMLTNMIEQHYNHPSIILWGLGNENDWPGAFETFSKDSVRSFMGELNVLAHQLDATRMTSIRRCDFAKDIPDVYSPSIWAGWYSGHIKDYVSMTKKYFQNVDCFLHVEWGADSHAGRHSESDFDSLVVGNKNGDWSETYAVKLFDWHLKEQENMPWLTGSAFWTFRDFATPSRPDSPIPFMNQKGVTQRDGSLKESFYVFQSYWTNRLMAHIYGHTWPVRWGSDGEKKEVLVYSNASEAELFVNGVSQGIKKRNTQDYPAAGLHWQVKYQKGINHLRVVAHRGKQTINDEITQEYQTQKWGEPAQISITTEKCDGDTILVNVQLLDKKGIRCLDASQTVRFGFTGDGKLLDNQGTILGSRVIQTANGRASIKLRLQGMGAVSVQSKGLTTQVLELKLQ